MAAATERQVTGVDVTFLEAVEQSIVPTPTLMDWNDWQRWRRTTGMRPTYADDGAMLDNKSEVRLWRQAMEHLYGADWLEDLSLRTAGPAAQRAEASGPAASADQGADRSAAPVPAEAQRPAAAETFSILIPSGNLLSTLTAVEAV